MEQFRGLIELTRPVNAVAAGVLTFLGAYVGAGFTSATAAVGAAVGATVVATGAGNAINDYFDREIDRINDPDRPIPRGAVNARIALWFSVALFVLAVILALTLPVLAIAIAVINLLALVSYTSIFKGLPGAGNGVVAWLVGSTFLFGAAAVEALGWTVGTLAALAALATLSREIIKDVEDITGDREEGLQTLPIAIGERPALHVSTILLVGGIVASPLPYFQQAMGLAYLLVVLPAVALMGYAALVSYRDPARGQTVLKYGMFVAVVAFIVGRTATILG